MQQVILALLRLFSSRAPDPETHAWVLALAADRNKWPGAHDWFRQIRRRVLRDPKDDTEGHEARMSQYTFEELCLKAMYNESRSPRPFDPSSPYFVAGCAIRLAQTIGVPVHDVLAILESQANPETALYRQVFPGPVAVTSVQGRPATAEEVAKEFPGLEHFPDDPPGPYERNMGNEIAKLLRLFEGRVPDATSNAVVLKLAATPDRWSAGHALFDILHPRLLRAMRARDQVRYLQHEFERSCLQSLYNAAESVHPFAPGSPFWVPGAALTLARAVGVPAEAVVAVLAPTVDPA